MPKCPYCKSEEFRKGKIKLVDDAYNNGNVDVIYCSKCEAVIFYTGEKITAPHDETKKSSSSYGEAPTKWG